jgi:ABC-type glutathione transport system ATPase component
LVDVNDFPVADGCITFLFGESGIGKSLIAKALFGVMDDPDLRVSINGKRFQGYHGDPYVEDRQRNGFFVFQEPSSHLNPLLTIDDQLHEGSLAAHPSAESVAEELWDGKESDSFRRILPVFPEPHRPSGGEKQRILGSMALQKMDIVAGRPEGSPALFVFDEPTGSLDREGRDRFLERIFARFQRRHETILFVTHDYGIISFVRSKGGSIASRVRYRELHLEGDRQLVRDFNPDKFLSWLGSLHPDDKGGAGRPAVLSVESNIRVFGRTMQFVDPEKKTAGGPMIVRKGDCVYLKAASGIGKTTIAKIVVGLQEAQHFRMVLEGTRLGEISPKEYWRKRIWGRDATMAFQHADEALNLRSTVANSLGILPAARGWGEDKLKSALALLFSLEEIPRLFHRKVWQLSGGQKQRLNLLRAFMLSTPLLILDEPLNALDFESITRVLDLISARRKTGQGVLLISHNEDIFQALIPPQRIYGLTVEGA